MTGMNKVVEVVVEVVMVVVVVAMMMMMVVLVSRSWPEPWEFQVANESVSQFVMVTTRQGPDPTDEEPP